MFLRTSILVVLFFVVGGINLSGEPPLWVFACLLLQLLLLLSGWLTGTSCHHAGLPTSLRLSLVTPCKLQICYKVQICLCLIGLFFWSSSWPKLQLWCLLTHSYFSFLEAEMNATRTFSLTRYYLFIKPFFFCFYT